MWPHQIIVCLVLVVGVLPELKREKPHEQAQLFPLYGVTLGVTTVEELARLGERGLDYDYYVINGHNFWFSAGIASMMYITYTSELPEPWQRLGFDWELSYLGWLEVLKKCGYTFEIQQAPHKEDFQGVPCFTAVIFARVGKLRVPVFITLEFAFEPGEEDTLGTLYSITIDVE